MGRTDTSGPCGIAVDTEPGGDGGGDLEVGTSSSAAVLLQTLHRPASMLCGIRTSVMEERRKARESRDEF